MAGPRGDAKWLFGAKESKGDPHSSSSFPGLSKPVNDDTINALAQAEDEAFIFGSDFKPNEFDITLSNDLFAYYPQAAYTPPSSNFLGGVYPSPYATITGLVDAGFVTTKAQGADAQPGPRIRRSHPRRRRRR